MSNKVYEIITNEIIDKLEAGTIPWSRPWNGEYSAKNFISGKEYRGINALLLGMMPYSCPFWATFKQIKEKGGNVRKGEKSTLVVFWKFIDRESNELDDNGEKKTNNVPFLRYYRVFNLEQADGIDWKAKIDHTEREFTPIEACSNIVNGFGDRPEIMHGGGRACYSPLDDKIKLPVQEDFKTDEGYYSTLFHELAHSTGHESRVNRNLSAYNPFGSKEYSKEELIAEIGAAFLCGIAGIKNEIIDNSASYIQSWLTVLKDRKNVKLIVTAAGQAQKAIDYITKDGYEPD